MASFKLLLIGDTDVGKSCLASRFVSDRFSFALKPTIGIDFRNKDIVIDGTNIKVTVGCARAGRVVGCAVTAPVRTGICVRGSFGTRPAKNASTRYPSRTFAAHMCVSACERCASWSRRRYRWPRPLVSGAR